MWRLQELQFFFTGCKKDDEGSPTPVITSLEPASGGIGSTLVITGANFSVTAYENLISFNNATGVQSSSATATTLQVSVPSNATTGKIKVTVNGVSVTSTQEFTVLKPSITSFNPAYGLPGTTVIINFSPAITGMRLILMVLRLRC